MTTLQKIIAIGQDNQSLTYAADPQPGQSPISAELAAVLTAAWRPVPIPAAPIQPLPPPPKPVLPPLTRRVVADRNADHRGDGLRITTASTVRDLLVDGFDQNLVVDAPGSVVLENLRSINAWRGSPADVYEGQGLYIGRGQVTVRDSLFAFNGWQPGRPWPAKIRYRHGIYQDLGAGPLLAEDCLFVRNASCGVQLRAGGVLRRCVFVGNAIHLLAIKEPVTLEDCLFIGGSRHVELDERNKPRSFVGNGGVVAYGPVTIRRCRFIATSGQASPNAELAGLRSWDMGVLNISSGHEKHPTGVGSITCEQVEAVGWPRSTLPNRAMADAVQTPFSGVPGIDGRTLVGFTDRPGSLPPVIAAAIDAAIQQALANAWSVRQAITTVTSLVREAIA